LRRSGPGPGRRGWSSCWCHQAVGQYHSTGGLASAPPGDWLELSLDPPQSATE
jgi:hypothetical protein